MEEELNFSQVPFNYPLCLNRQCPKASTCLRQLAEQSLPGDVEQLMIVNPKRIAAAESNCPYYRSSERVRYAKGFIGILDNLTHSQMRIVVSRLIGHFSRRTYYRIRKGERPLSPLEQKEILNILKNCGVIVSKDFDSYFEEYDW